MSKYVILVHGTMSRTAYNDICTKYKLPIYEYSPISWVDIFPYQESGFFRFQKIGSLYKQLDPDEWRGEIIHANWFD